MSTGPGPQHCAVLEGLGGYLPPGIVTNEMLQSRLDTTDTWIRTRTGIQSRHIADPDTATSDLAVEAGRRALRSAGTDHVDLVLLATTTPDHPCPATAPAVAARLGLVDVPAFDVGAVCAGFVYGLAVASWAIGSGFANRVLLIGADTFSTIIDPQDRSTAVIFGDGAGAVVLRAGTPAEPGAVLGVDLGSNGAHADLIQVRSGGSRERNHQSTSHPPDPYFKMAGREVFASAVRAMTDSSRAVLKDVQWTPEDVDLLVAHQANIRILTAVGQSLGIESDRTAVHLDRVGNTSAASIPLALTDTDIPPGSRVLLTAFGGGTAWGSAALIWPELTIQNHDLHEGNPA